MSKRYNVPHLFVESCAIPSRGSMEDTPNPSPPPPPPPPLPPVSPSVAPVPTSLTAEAEAGAPAEPWTDDLDLMPQGKRQRTLEPDKPPSPSSSSAPPCDHLASPVDMAAKLVSLDVLQEWPGLPRGVKFDPSDEDLLWHLVAKVGKGEAEPHPLISEFIISLDEDVGHTHPQRLVGVKQDGSVSYFFHRRFKAFNSGNRKCQKVQTADAGVVCWHRTYGKMKPVIIDGIHRGCKKIMVLYEVMKKGEKPERTNWVMHQYHIGTGEDGEGEFVVSKIYYQQKYRQSDKNAQDLNFETAEAVVLEAEAAVDPISPGPKIHAENQYVDHISAEASAQAVTNFNRCGEIHTHAEYGELGKCDSIPKEDPNGGEIELLDAQQHVENIITFEDLCQTQSSCAAEAERSLSCISDNALICVPTLGKELGECQNGDPSTPANNVSSECVIVSSECVTDCTSEFTTQEIFKSREAMIKWVRDKGRMNGFVIVIKTSVTGGHGIKPRVTFGCERSGKYRNMGKKKEQTEKRQRMSTTKKCDCPFVLKGNKLPNEDDWNVVVVSGVHNHLATEHPKGHSYAGRLSEEENLLLVDLSKSLVRPKDILMTLKQRDPLNAATMKTIYNARQRFKLSQKVGRSPIQSLMSV